MTWAERLQSVFVAVASLGGLGAGLASPLGVYGEYVVIPALLVMLVAVFVQLDASHLKDVGKAKGLVAVSLVLNYAFTPLLAWALGLGLLGGQPDLRIGLLLLLVTPCTDWYLVFTAMARGHGGIATALLPVNLVLQLLLLPVYVMLLGGEAAMVGTGTLIEAVGLMLLTPLVVAFTLRWVSTRVKGDQWRDEHVNTWANRIVMPLLCLAVFAMFTWQAPVVAESGAEMLLLLPPLLAFFILLPLVSTGVARLMRLTGS